MAIETKRSFDVCKLSGRPRTVVEQELAKEREKLLKLWAAVSAEREKRSRQDARIERAKQKWQQDHPGEPFDPSEFNQDLKPIPLDARLHEEFRVQHHAIKALEDELEGKPGE